MTKIIVVYFDGNGDEEKGFTAYPEDHKDLMTIGGCTAVEAIGTLIVSHPEMFHVEVDFTLLAHRLTNRSIAARIAESQ